MLTTEQALDMVPHVVGIVDKLNLQAKGKELLEQARREAPDASVDALQRQVGQALVMHIGRNLARIKEDALGLIAAAAGCTMEEARLRPLSESLRVLREVFSDPELLGFFRSAVQ